jgi:PAS domain S-box-containing protein
MEQMTPDRNSIWERLIQPHSAVTNPDRRSQVRVLAAFILGLSILTLLASIVYFLIFGTVIIEFWLALALYSLVYLLSRSARPILGEFAVVIGITGLIIFLLTTRGSLAENLAWAVVPILIGAILLPMWATIIFTLLNIAIPVAIALSTSQLDPFVTFNLAFMLIFAAGIALATKHARQRTQEKLERQAVALASSRAQYKQLFDDVPVGLFESTVNGEIVQANQALLQILGFPDQQALQGVTASELYVDPADRERWQALLEEKGSLRDFEIQLIRTDGQQIWVREQVRAVPTQDGKISAFRGSIEDVTERKWLQNQLAEQHQKLQMIIGAMPNVLIVVDEQNRLTALYMPPDFPPLLKQRWVTAMESLIEVLPPELAAQIQSSIETVRQTGVGKSFEQAVPSVDKEQSTYLRAKLSPVTETGDILIVVDDVTELKQAEETVRTYATELELRNAELDAFSHTVAHDLRRPLSHIVGYADMVRLVGKDELSPQTSEFLERIGDAALNMSEMIQSLLMLAQLRDTNEVVEPVNMSTLIDTALKRVQPEIEKRGVYVEVVQPVPDALGYAPWLEEVFANLINNAVQYIGQSNTDPTITIRAVAQGEHLRYEVVDNGLGIPLEHQPHLFDMLTRFHQDQSSGTGLGLSIVQRIVNKLGGTVGVKSEPGQGSIFWFTLPVAPDEATV